MNKRGKEGLLCDSPRIGLTAWNMRSREHADTHSAMFKTENESWDSIVIEHSFALQWLPFVARST